MADGDTDGGGGGGSSTQWWMVVLVVVVVVVVQNGGWWYGQCSTSDINRNSFVTWKTVGSTKDVRATRMLVKLN